MTGGWVTHADHARWQLQAARELAAILGEFGGLPLLAWTVVPAGPLLEASAVHPGRSARSHLSSMAAAAIWHNWQASILSKRSLTAYDH